LFEVEDERKEARTCTDKNRKKNGSGEEEKRAEKGAVPPFKPTKSKTMENEGLTSIPNRVGAWMVRAKLLREKKKKKKITDERPSITKKKPQTLRIV